MIKLGSEPNWVFADLDLISELLVENNIPIEHPNYEKYKDYILGKFEGTWFVSPEEMEKAVLQYIPKTASLNFRKTAEPETLQENFYEPGKSDEYPKGPKKPRLRFPFYNYPDDQGNIINIKPDISNPMEYDTTPGPHPQGPGICGSLSMKKRAQSKGLLTYKKLTDIMMVVKDLQQVDSLDSDEVEDLAENLYNIFGNDILSGAILAAHEDKASRFIQMIGEYLALSTKIGLKPLTKELLESLIKVCQDPSNPKHQIKKVPLEDVFEPKKEEDEFEETEEEIGERWKEKEKQILPEKKELSPETMEVPYTFLRDKYTEDEIWDIARGRKTDVSPEEIEMAKFVIERGIVAGRLGMRKTSTTVSEPTPDESLHEQQGEHPGHTYFQGRDEWEDKEPDQGFDILFPEKVRIKRDPWLFEDNPVSEMTASRLNMRKKAYINLDNLKRLYEGQLKHLGVYDRELMEEVRTDLLVNLENLIKSTFKKYKGWEEEDIPADLEVIQEYVDGLKQSLKKDSDLMVMIDSTVNVIHHFFEDHGEHYLLSEIVNPRQIERAEELLATIFSQVSEKLEEKEEKPKPSIPKKVPFVDKRGNPLKINDIVFAKDEGYFGKYGRIVSVDPEPIYLSDLEKWTYSMYVETTVTEEMLATEVVLSNDIDKDSIAVEATNHILQLVKKKAFDVNSAFDVILDELYIVLDQEMIQKIKNNLYDEGIDIEKEAKKLLSVRKNNSTFQLSIRKKAIISPLQLKKLYELELLYRKGNFGIEEQLDKLSEYIVKELIEFLNDWLQFYIAEEGLNEEAKAATNRLESCKQELENAFDIDSKIVAIDTTINTMHVDYDVFEHLIMTFEEYAEREFRSNRKEIQKHYQVWDSLKTFLQEQGKLTERIFENRLNMRKIALDPLTQRELLQTGILFPSPEFIEKMNLKKEKDKEEQKDKYRSFQKPFELKHEKGLKETIRKNIEEQFIIPQQLKLRFDKFAQESPRTLGPQITKQKIRRLYEQEAKGIYDEELLDEIISGFLVTLESWVNFEEYKIKYLLQYVTDDSYDLIREAEDLIQPLHSATTPQEKMIAIDTVINIVHQTGKYGEYLIKGIDPGDLSFFDDLSNLKVSSLSLKRIAQITEVNIGDEVEFDTTRYFRVGRSKQGGVLKGKGIVRTKNEDGSYDIEITEITNAHIDIAHIFKPGRTTPFLVDEIKAFVKPKFEPKKEIPTPVEEPKIEKPKEVKVEPEKVPVEKPIIFELAEPEEEEIPIPVEEFGEPEPKKLKKKFPTWKELGQIVWESFKRPVTRPFGSILNMRKANKISGRKLLSVGLWAIYNGEIYSKLEDVNKYEGHENWFVELGLPVKGTEYDYITRGIYRPDRIVWYEGTGTFEEFSDNIEELRKKLELPENVKIESAPGFSEIKKAELDMRKSDIQKDVPIESASPIFKPEDTIKNKSMEEATYKVMEYDPKVDEYLIVGGVKDRIIRVDRKTLENICDLVEGEGK